LKQAVKRLQNALPTVVKNYMCVAGAAAAIAAAASAIDAVAISARSSGILIAENGPKSNEIQRQRLN
jgi:hypothetical protein